MGNTTNSHSRVPWNKGKLVGQKASFKACDAPCLLRLNSGRIQRRLPGVQTSGCGRFWPSARSGQWIASCLKHKPLSGTATSASAPR